MPKKFDVVWTHGEVKVDPDGPWPTIEKATAAARLAVMNTGYSGEWMIVQRSSHRGPNPPGHGPVVATGKIDLAQLVFEGERR